MTESNSSTLGERNLTATIKAKMLYETHKLFKEVYSVTYRSANMKGISNTPAAIIDIFSRP